MNPSDGHPRQWSF